MKYITLFFIIFVSILNGQNRFEKGKIETDKGELINAFIGVYNWEYFPELLDYKTELDGSIQRIKSTEINAVYLDNGVNYFKKTLEIDSSSNAIDQLDNTREIKTDLKTVFLRQIVDGKANLYIYTGGKKIIFFYETPTQKLEALIYKEYLNEDYKIKYNKTYLSQLQNNLSCKDIFKNVNYTKNSLSKYFLKYNQCSGDDNTVSKKKFKLNMKLLIGVNSNNIKVDNSYLLNSNTLEFTNQISPKIGIEIEGYIPSKRADFFSPFVTIANRNYQTNEAIRTVNFDIKYSGIEINPGLRYYLNLKNNQYVFADFGAVINITMTESLSSDLFPTSEDNSLFDSSSASLAFGVGYKINKWSAALKYYFPTNFEGVYIIDSSELTSSTFFTKMNNISFQIMYDIF